MRNRQEGGEQVAAGQQEQRPRAGDVELAEQEDRSDQVVDHQRQFIDRDEGRQRGERNLRERRRREEDHDGDQHHRERDPVLVASRGQGRQENRRLQCQLACHRRLP